MTLSRRRAWEIGAAAGLFLVLAVVLGAAVQRWRQQERATRALHDALESGDSAGARKALQAGADARAEWKRRADASPLTPVEWTLYGGDAEALHWLLRYGADPNFRDEDGETPLMMFHGDYNDESLHARMVRELLSAGADPNARDAQGRTPLMHLVGEDAGGNCPEAVRLLLSAGANARARDTAGNTALDLARRSGQDAGIVRLLRQAGSE